MNPRDQRHIEEADGFIELELHKQALEALDRVSPEGRKSFEWNQFRANALIATQQYPQALLCLNTAKELNANSVPVLLSMGWCFKRMNQLPRAIEALKSAEKLCRRGHFADSHALVMYNLSCYFALAHRKSDMLHWLGRAIKADAKYRKHLVEETDFDQYRRDPEFVALLNSNAPGNKTGSTSA